MTLEDKIRQMSFADAAGFAKNGKFDPAQAKKICNGLGFGGLQEPRLSTPEKNAISQCHPEISDRKYPAGDSRDHHRRNAPWSYVARRDCFSTGHRLGLFMESRPDRSDDDNHRTRSPGRDYVFQSPKPLYEFGFGLSYTTFKYSNLRVSSTTINPNAEITVSVDVTNTGKHPGKEVVQLYINDVVCSVTTPVKVLRGFTKIDLKPGKKQTVEFTLGPKDLALINEKFETTVEPGVFEVMIGNLKKTFRVI